MVLDLLSHTKLSLWSIVEIDLRNNVSLFQPKQQQTDPPKKPDTYTHTTKKRKHATTEHTNAPSSGMTSTTCRTIVRARFRALHCINFQLIQITDAHVVVVHTTTADVML
jgi:hypothetical protein